MTINHTLSKMNSKYAKMARAQSARKAAAILGIVAAVGTGAVVIAGTLFTFALTKKERVKMMNHAFNAAEDMKDAVLQKAEDANDCAAHAKKEAHNILSDLHDKSDEMKDDIKDDLKDESDKISKNFHKTVIEISKDIKAK